ncbi:MAG: zinc ribbon domain-containing protein [Candidatus Margulisbacteria bacterium]|jgi:endogenous inhibitor of DNA gyrase (YacG/DUF329 family)|nr:zinc ribbon domain-containing protein [Candidatus Margulisiibacteriota bacterium]
MGNQRKCPSCQKLINSGAKFCNFCGQRQTAVPPAVDLSDRKFISALELAAIRDELAGQDSSVLTGLFTHSNKYLVRTALELFLEKTGQTAAPNLKKYFSDADFTAVLLDLQVDSAELFAELWPPASENPWLARKYLLWAARRKYRLSAAAAQYLANAADAYLQKALEQ